MCPICFISNPYALLSETDIKVTLTCKSSLFPELGSGFYYLRSVLHICEYQTAFAKMVNLHFVFITAFIELGVLSNLQQFVWSPNCELCTGTLSSMYGVCSAYYTCLLHIYGRKKSFSSLIDYFQPLCVSVASFAILSFFIFIFMPVVLVLVNACNFTSNFQFVKFHLYYTLLFSLEHSCMT